MLIIDFFSTYYCNLLFFFLFLQHLWTKLFPVLLCSYRAIWTRSTKTNFGGYLWRYKSLFRTAARPSSVMMACTESWPLLRHRRNSTTRRRSRRTTWRRARRNGCMTPPSRRHCLWGSALHGEHWLLDLIQGEDWLNFGSSVDQWQDWVEFWA